MTSFATHVNMIIERSDDRVRGIGSSLCCGVPRISRDDPLHVHDFDRAVKRARRDQRS